MRMLSDQRSRDKRSLSTKKRRRETESDREASHDITGFLSTHRGAEKREKKRAKGVRARASAFARR